MKQFVEVTHIDTVIGYRQRKLLPVYAFRLAFDRGDGTSDLTVNDMHGVPFTMHVAESVDELSKLLND